MRSILMAALAMACFAFPGMAASDDQFERDRQVAERSITPQLQQSCVSDFARTAEHRAGVRPDGAFAFNSLISREIYRTIYWRQSDRGVAFTVPVRLRDPQRGEIAGNLACFYAVTDAGLVFESAQPIAWKF